MLVAYRQQPVQLAVSSSAQTTMTTATSNITSGQVGTTGTKDDDPAVQTTEAGAVGGVPAPKR